MAEETFTPCKFCKTPDECTAAAKCIEKAKRHLEGDFVRRVPTEDDPPLPQIEQLSNWCKCDICTDGK